MMRKLSRYAMRLMIGLIAAVVIVICIDHALFNRGDDASIDARLFYSELNGIHIDSDGKTGSANRNGNKQNRRKIPEDAEEIENDERKKDPDKSHESPEDTANNNYSGIGSHETILSYDRVHGDSFDVRQQASDDSDRGDHNSQRSEFDIDSMDALVPGRQSENDTHRLESSNKESVVDHMSSGENSDGRHIGNVNGPNSDERDTARDAGESMYSAGDPNHHDESFDHGAAENDPRGQAVRPNYGGGKVIGDGHVVLGVIPVQRPEANLDQPGDAQKGPGSRRGKPGRKGKELLDDFASKWNISEEIRRLAPVVFKFVPPTFHPGYKGYCWINMNSDLRCMPYFYLLGMPKCGTTDLWDRMVEHPHIIRVLKEPHWWTRGNRNTPRAYISRSISTVKKIAQQPASASKYVLGDGSASYLWDMKKWQEVFDPDDPNKQLFLPHAIRAVTPKAKLIAAFREPVARLYSEYVYFSRNPSPAAFHDTVTRRIGEFNACTETHSERKCVYQKALENGEIRPMIGIYSVFARDWLDVFPREQMLFVRLEDWHHHCVESMPNIFEFLEVERLPDKNINKICRIQTKNVNRKKADVGPILEKTKVFLREFYARWNRDLADLLEDDRWLWNDVTD